MLDSITQEAEQGEQQERWLLDSILKDIDSDVSGGTGFVPAAPKTLEETGLEETQVESLILKYLFHRGSATCGQISEQHKLPFNIVTELARKLKDEQVVGYRRSVGLSDYELQLGETGLIQARRYNESAKYFGAAPVPHRDYIESISKQSPTNLRLTMSHLRRALSDLSIVDEICGRLGQAMTAGRALFLYGRPGNGKTSIAERLSAAYGESVWIPRAVEFGGEIVRLFDPIVHEEIEMSETDSKGIDQRWVKIRRPTIVVGGELKMEHLEFQFSAESGTCEAPVQLKSNTGVLVIDDFGRQQMDPTDLLNRWIVPLEKRYDFYNLPTGKKVQIPFDQLLIFSTNLEPKDIVDEAFLRRIPYKVEIGDPTDEQFRSLFLGFAEKLELSARPEILDYLFAKHYAPLNRPLRFCHPRDLLLQVKNFCEFHEASNELTEDRLDDAVENYFGLME